MRKILAAMVILSTVSAGCVASAPIHGSGEPTIAFESTWAVSGAGSGMAPFSGLAEETPAPSESQGSSWVLNDAAGDPTVSLTDGKGVGQHNADLRQLSLSRGAGYILIGITTEDANPNYPTIAPRIHDYTSYEVRFRTSEWPSAVLEARVVNGVPSDAWLVLRNGAQTLLMDGLPMLLDPDTATLSIILPGDLLSGTWEGIVFQVQANVCVIGAPCAESEAGFVDRAPDAGDAPPFD